MTGAPQVPELQPGAAHLWWIHARKFAADDVQLVLLEAAERARAERFRFARDRDRFLSRRVAQRLLLASYAAIAPAAVRVTRDAGRPELAPGLAPFALRFSISASQDRALFAVWRDRPIGIDLEALRGDQAVEEIEDRVCDAPARARLAAMPLAARRRAVYRGWTRLEAVAKATGIGVYRWLDERPDLGRALWCNPADRVQIDAPEGPFTCASLPLDPVFEVAIAVAGRELPDLRVFSFG